ncbi:MAG: hypothetical protein ACI9OJ_005499 [Myxococcota bacterium]
MRLARRATSWKTWRATSSGFGTPAAFTTYLSDQWTTRRHGPAFLNQIFSNLPEKERPVWGQRWEKNDAFGNVDYFALDYLVTAGWHLDAPANLCQLTAQADARLNFGTTILNNHLEILDTGFVAATGPADQPNQNAYEFGPHLAIFTFDWWTPFVPEEGTERTPSLDYAVNVAFDGETIEREEGQSFETPIFSIAGFNIILRAGFGARLGLTAGGEVQLAANFDGSACQAGLDLKRPEP